MHTLLSHQLHRCFGSADAIPQQLETLVPLVDAAYREVDDDRRLLEAIIESTTDGLLVVDRLGRMVRMNRKFAELWRIPPEILALRDDIRALAFVIDQLQEPEEFLAKIRDLYENPETDSFDTLKFRDGRVFERYSMPHRIDGVITGRVWSFRDVTRRLELEDQLRQSQKMEAIGLLAGGVAHDFNNLLTVIGGHAEFLQMEEGIGPEAREDVAEIRKAAARAAGLTRQLLAFGRKQLLRPVVLDFNEVISELTPMLERLIAEDIRIEFSPARHPAFVTADRGQVEQVLLNLVVNARDAMRRGGRIGLRVANVELRDDTRTRARGGVAGPHVHLSVSDTGDGIDADCLARIFEPFYTTKAAGKGTGLGLATVYGIVRQSGGFVEVHSVVNAGTTFDLFFPAAPATVVHTEDIADELASRAPVSETILVVEDQDALRELLRRALEQAGYTVLVANSGRDALARVLDHEGRIHLVVTDVVMPLMSGPELVKHLGIARPDVRVLYVSGYTDDEVLRRGVVQADTDLLEKPFTTEQLVAAVRRVLDGPAPPRT